MIARGTVLAAVLVAIVLLVSAFRTGPHTHFHKPRHLHRTPIYASWHRIEIISTAYVVNPAEVGHSYNGIPCIVNLQLTSTGTKPGVGTAAVDTKVFPYGTRFYFVGYGFAEAQDTGVIGRIVDLVEPTCKRAIIWGRQVRLAYVLYPTPNRKRVHERT